MATVDLIFMNVDDESEVDVGIDDTWTPEQIIQALIDANFLQPLTDPTRSYTLAIKGRNTIIAGQTLSSAGVRPNDRIRIEIAQLGGKGEHDDESARVCALPAPQK